MPLGETTPAEPDHRPRRATYLVAIALAVLAGASIATMALAGGHSPSPGAPSDTDARVWCTKFVDARLGHVPADYVIDSATRDGDLWVVAGTATTTDSVVSYQCWLAPAAAGGDWALTDLRIASSTK